jgi:hypothetical protein
MRELLQSYQQAHENTTELRRQLDDVDKSSAAQYSLAREFAQSEFNEEQLQESLAVALGVTLDVETNSWLGMSLANDENTSDEELRELYKENGLSVDQIDAALALRPWFMGDFDAHL